MITLFALFLAVVWFVVCIGLWMQFSLRQCRAAILMWGLGAPLMCGTLLFAVRPMADLASFIVVVGACMAIAGLVVHVSCLRSPQGEGARGGAATKKSAPCVKTARQVWRESHSRLSGSAR